MPSAKVAFLGCGEIGTAVLSGILLASHDFELRACVRSTASVARVQKTLGERASAVYLDHGSDSLASAAQWADIVLLGCVPGDLENLLNTPGVGAELRGKLVVSMLAGTSATRISSVLYQQNPDKVGDFHVARMIPTMAAMYGKSVSFLSAPAAVPHGETLKALLNSFGTVIEVAEDQMNDAIAVGATCHAIAMQAVDAVADAGVASGISRTTALQMAAETLNGASFLLSPSGGGATPESLKASMSTPRGVTINAYLALQKAAVPAGIAQATRAAIEHARDM